MSDVTIEVKENGPLLVKGDIQLTDADGNAFDTDRTAIALCRCGASKSSPFCDGTHKKIKKIKKIGFESAPKAA